MKHVQPQVLGEIIAERQRQDDLVRKNKHPFNCSDKSVDDERKLPVLGEEFGEVCKAVYERKHHPESAESSDHVFQLCAKYKAHLRTELIQLAAVATAWAESLS